MKYENLLVSSLKDNELKIATAESCTGGLVAASIVNVSGASEVFGTGIVCYDNDTKTNLVGVHPKIIATHSAVSKECALAMAKGILAMSGADIGISTTGYADTGEIYIGLVSKDAELVAAVENTVDDRNANREIATNFAIKTAYQFIEEVQRRKNEGYKHSDLESTVNIFIELSAMFKSSADNVSKWVRTISELNDDYERRTLVVATEIKNVFLIIEKTYGIAIAKQLFDLQPVVLSNEILEAAKYLFVGGQIDNIAQYAADGLFMQIRSSSEMKELIRLERVLK